jgi:hypothetical protein
LHPANSDSAAKSAAHKAVVENLPSTLSFVVIIFYRSFLHSAVTNGGDKWNGRTASTPFFRNAASFCPAKTRS